MATSNEQAVPGDPQATPQVAEKQQAAAEWPKPGDEGYVHPDGTPQSRQQLEDNRRAAADRAAAGSIIHGAPLATPGPDPERQTAAAAERAESYGGKTTQEARKDLAGWIDDASQKAADEAAKRQDATPASEVGKRDADQRSPKSAR
jgi:hypothetical protein